MKNTWILTLITAFALSFFHMGCAAAQEAAVVDSTSPAEAKEVPPGETAYEQGRRFFFLGKYEEAIEQ